MQLDLRKSIIALALGGAMFTLSTGANAAFLCEHNKAGDIVDISGSVLQQENGKIFKQKGKNKLIHVDGYSDGVKLDSFLAIREGLYEKVARCRHGATSQMSFRVKCTARGEPEVIQVVC